MNKLIALRNAEKEKLWKDFQREEEERMVIVERLKNLFQTDPGLSEVSAAVQ